MTAGAGHARAGRADVAVGTHAIGRRALHGLAWALGQNVLARVIGLASQLYLAALLSPTDFGLIGLTFTVTAVASALVNVGLDDVLLQRHRALPLWLGAAFWISLALAVAAGLLVALASPLMAFVYGAPELTGLLCVLAVGIPIGALQTAPALLLRARMRFDTLSIVGVAEIAAQSALTVLLAYRGYGAYSFAIPIPLVALAKLLYLWHAVPESRNFRPMVRRWKYISGSTTTVLVTRSLITLINQADYVILGLVASKAVVGTYYFAFRLAVQPVWVLAGNLNGVIFPALAQLKSDPVRQGRAAVRAATLLSYGVMPTAFLIAGLAEPLVGGVYGDKWTDAIPIIQILSVGIAFDAVSWVAGALISARSEFGLTLRHVAVQVPLFVVLVATGALAGEGTGAALGVAAFYATTQPVYVYAALRRVGVPLREVAAIYVKPTLLAGLSVAAGLLLASPPALAGHPFARGAIILGVGAVAYGILVRLWATDTWDDVVARLRGAATRRLAARAA